VLLSHEIEDIADEVPPPLVHGHLEGLEEVEPVDKPSLVGKGLGEDGELDLLEEYAVLVEGLN
jgi:hypothetical protein